MTPRPRGRSWDVAIRTDGGKSIGMGHVARCCSIAEALRERGAIVGFICGDGQAIRYIEERGFEAVSLGTCPGSLVDASADVAAVAGRGARLAIVDALSVAPEYIKQLRRIAPTCQITPSLETASHADILVNYSGYKGEEYYKPSGLEGKICLFGMRYAPFGREYWGMRRRTLGKNVRRILVTCGGADPAAAVPFALDAIDEAGSFADAVKDVVIGRFARYPTGIVEGWMERADVEVHVAPSSLLDLEGCCDLCICAAGTTVYELLAFGVPVVCFATADNQLQVGALDGLVSWCGDVREQGSGLAGGAVRRRVSAAVARLSDPGERFALAAASEGKVDFGGARRLADELMRAVDAFDRG